MVFWNFPKETWQTNNLFSGTYKIVPLVWFKYLVRSFASDSNKQTRKSTFAAIHSQKTESSKHLTKSRREDVTDSAWSVAVVSSWGSSDCQKTLNLIKLRLLWKMGFSLSLFQRKRSRSLMLRLCKFLVEVQYIENIVFCWVVRSILCYLLWIIRKILQCKIF